MRPLRHRLCVSARQQAAAHEDAQQPLAHALLHRGERWRIEPGGDREDDSARGGGVEHAVEDDAVKTERSGVSVQGHAAQRRDAGTKMEVGIEGGTEAVDEGHRAEARRAPSAGTARAQTFLHHAQEQAQSRALKADVALTWPSKATSAT